MVGAHALLRYYLQKTHRTELRSVRASADGTALGDLRGAHGVDVFQRRGPWGCQAASLKPKREIAGAGAFRASVENVTYSILFPYCFGCSDSYSHI